MFGDGKPVAKVALENAVVTKTDAETMCLDLAGSTENDCKFAERRCTDFGMCISLNLDESELFADALNPLLYRKSAVDMKIESVTKALSHGSDADGFYLSRVLQHCAAVAVVDSSPGLGRKRSMSHKEWNKLVHAMIGNTTTTTTTKVTSTTATTTRSTTASSAGAASRDDRASPSRSLRWRGGLYKNVRGAGSPGGEGADPKI